MKPDAGRLKFLTLASVFLWIGITGFGGALATMALMEQEWVRSRKRLPDKKITCITNSLDV